MLIENYSFYIQTLRYRFTISLNINVPDMAFSRNLMYLVMYLLSSPGSEGPDASLDDAHPPEGVPGSSSQGKVNPYSVIDINPFQLQQLEPQQGPSSPVEPKEQEGDVQDILSTPAGITSGYSVPVPCGYATPSGVPLITPAYTTPVIIRHLSTDEDGKVEPAAGTI